MADCLVVADMVSCIVHLEGSCGEVRVTCSGRGDVDGMAGDLDDVFSSVMCLVLAGSQIDRYPTCGCVVTVFARVSVNN